MRLFAGGLCAVLAGWVAVAFGIWLTLATLDHLNPKPYLFPPPEYLIGFGVPWLMAFAVIGFVMGLVCAGFWRGAASLEQQKHWAIGPALIFFIPSAIMSVGALCLLAIAFPLLLFALNQGLEKWARHRHFFGLSNDWEREENQR